MPLAVEAEEGTPGVSLFLLPLAAGVVLGLARRGSLGRMADLGLRAPGLPLGALVAQAALGTGPARALPDGARFAVVVASYAAVGAWLAGNAAWGPPALRWALALLGAGWLLNALAVVANGGMPVSASGLERIGAPASYAVDEGHLFKHVRAGADTAVPWLGDVLPVPALRSVLSAGDLVMAGGIVFLVSSAMASRSAGGGAMPRLLAAAAPPGPHARAR